MTTSREQFEAAMLGRFTADEIADRKSNGDYSVTELRGAWIGWQARAALPAWRPISEAPRDGTVVMFYIPGEQIKFARSDDYHYGAYWLEKATHFMPLPEPPHD